MLFLKIKTSSSLLVKLNQFRVGNLWKQILVRLCWIQDGLFSTHIQQGSWNIIIVTYYTVLQDFQECKRVLVVRGKPSL